MEYIEVEERVNTLELTVESFVISTNAMLARMERDTAKFKNEIRDFKDEVRAETKAMKKQWCELANKWGTVVEDIVAPNIPNIAKENFGIDDFDLFAIRFKKKNTVTRTILKEFDIIAVSEKYFIVNETKATPRSEYVQNFIDVIKRIDEYFPEYKEKRLIPIFASLNIPNDIEIFLTKNKIYAMGMRDDTMELLNFNQLKE